MAAERTIILPNQETTESVELLQGAELIVRLRELYGWVQNKLADETGLSQGYLSQLENGQIKISPSFIIVMRLARALGVGINFWEKGLADNKVFLTPQARSVHETFQYPKAIGPKMALVVYVETVIPKLDKPEVTYIDYFPTSQRIGNKIRQLRQSLEIGQRRLASDTLITQGYISQLEGASVHPVENPKMNILRKIAKALNLDIYELLDLVEVEYPELVVRVDRFFRNDKIPPETKATVGQTISLLLNNLEDPILNRAVEASSTQVQ